MCACANLCACDVGCVSVCQEHATGVDIELSVIICFITRFWLVEVVEVFAAILLGVWPDTNVGAQAGCFDAAFGYRLPPRHARTLAF